MLKVKCGGCGKVVKGGEDWAGRSARCPGCQAVIVFPAIERLSSPAAVSVGSVLPAEIPNAVASVPVQTCGCCGQETPATAGNCVHCGEVLWNFDPVAPAVDAEAPTEPQPTVTRERDEPELVAEPATPGANLVARGAGVLMALLPIVGFVYDAKSHGQYEDVTPIFYVSLLSLAFLGVPGVYLLFKGALGGPAGRVNRAGGALLIAIGLGLILVGVGASFLASWIGTMLGLFGAVWVGMLGLGAVMAALGFAGLVSGRNLLEELSQVELGRK